MAEQHEITGPAQALPLRRGAKGVQIRIPISGTPSESWRANFQAWLAASMEEPLATRFSDLDRSILDGNELVLRADSIDDAGALAKHLATALAEMNERELEREKNPPPANMSQANADAFAEAFNRAAAESL